MARTLAARILFAAAAGLAASMSHAAPHPIAAPPPLPQPVVRRNDGDWTKYCGDLLMDGVASAEVSLYPESVPGLELLWSRRLSGPIASSPTVASGRVFVGDWSGVEWALDAESGAVLASANLGTTTAPQCNPASLGITSAPAYAGGRLYLAGGDDGFYALDASTLATLWRVSLGNNSATGGYYGWCSPSVVGGVVLQGVSSNCDDPFVPGRLVAFEAASGSPLAVASLTPPGVSGSGVWTSPAVDLATRSVFVTTASASHVDDGEAFSIVRLDLDTLAIEDLWRLDDPEVVQADYDWGSSPTLFVTQDGRSLVGAGQKNGSYYAFERSDLAAGPVWTTPVCAGGSVPQSGQGTLSTAAFDGTRLYLGGGAPLGTNDPALTGTMTALDPSTGVVLWRRSFAGPVIAPVSFANGVVFSTAGSLAFALDAASGIVLWSSPTAGGCFGGVAIAHGRIYFGDLAGTLYCFSIKGTTP